MQCCPKCQEGIGLSVSPGPCAVCDYDGTEGSENTRKIKAVKEWKRQKHLRWRREIELVLRDWGFVSNTPNHLAERIERLLWGKIEPPDPGDTDHD